VAFVQSLPFTYLHVFPIRPAGDRRYRLSGQVNVAARGRSAELRATGEALALATGQARRRNRVIVVRADRREGLTEDYLQVELDGPRLARGTRLTARLAGERGRLTATPA
jgi:hypothetical protein